MREGAEGSWRRQPGDIVGLVVWTVISYVGVLCLIAVVVGAIWLMRKQERDFPKGTRAPERNEQQPGEPRWTGMYHRGGQGGL